jgi:NAD(P)-dependent dehydrogenase (short-subunit alcohol dehydrogenase family)
VQASLESLTRVKTLRALVEAVTPLLADEPAAAIAAGRIVAPDPAVSRAASPEAGASEPPRFLATVVEAPLADHRAAALPAGVIVVTADGGGIAGLAAAGLEGRGARVVVVSAASEFAERGSGRYALALEDPGQVGRLVEEVRRRHGPIGGILHLSPLGHGADVEMLDACGWQARLGRQVKGLFHLVRAAGKDIQSTAGGFVAGVTGLDGAFGCRDAGSGFPGDGGVLGLVKTLAVEWPAARCKAIDVDPADPPDVVSRNVLGELGADDPEVEVGYAGNRRVVPRVMPAPFIEGDGQAPLGSDSVVLVTGGARGITAEVAEELARRYRPTLVLVGRQPLPEAEEPRSTAGLDSARELKSALMAELRRNNGRPPAPAELERAYRALLRDREVRRRLGAMREAGATVAYRQVDVRDARGFQEVIEDVYRTQGRIDGVIHGAGLIEDKLLLDKTTESFDRVFDTKTVGAFALARALRPGSLRFLVFFSSVAGRFANRGQGDYVAANEVLNKLARRLDAEWPGRVVALAWGPWSGGGMVSGGVARQFAERGIELIQAAAGRRMFDAELRHGDKAAAEVVIGGGPWPVVEGRPREAAPGSAAGAPPVDAPIVSRLIVGRGSALEFTHELDVARDLYLDDHRIDGKPVLPAAMAAELMAEVAGRGWPDLQVARIRGFRVLRGVVLSNGAKPIRLSANPRTRATGEEGELQVDVELVEAGVAQPAYRATVVLASRLPEAPLGDFAAVDGLRSSPVDAAGAYRDLLFHGPRFQCIVEFAGFAPAGIVAAVQPSSPADCLAHAHADRWLIDPIALDAGPQLAIVWARTTLGMTALPARFTVLRRFRPLNGSGPGRCYFRVDPRSTEHTVVADVYFLGPDGRLALVVEGLESTCSQALNRLTAPGVR